MSLPVEINDGSGTSAKVTRRGELVIGQISHSTSYAQSRSTAGTSTIVNPQTGKRFVMTAMLLTQDKTNLDTHVTIFEAPDFESTTESKVIIETDLQRNQTMLATGLDIITESTVWINLKTDAAAGINITIAGYYVDA